MRRGFTIIQFLIAVGILLLLGALLLSIDWMMDIPVALAFGWATYLQRVVPQAKPDPWTVGTAVACLACVVFGGHAFLRWLAGGESRWSWKWSLRCVGLVVLMFVAGIAMVGATHQTAWLIRSPEPLTYSRGTHRSQSSNNLKQIGVSVHNRYGDLVPNEIARSSFDATGQPMHSWQTALLPYVEQDAVYKQIDHTKPWTHSANAESMAKRMRPFLNYSFNEQQVNGFGASHYAGNVFVVMGDAKTFESFPAGVSNTILAGEVSSNFRAWGDPLNARDPRLGVTGHPRGFGGPNGKPAIFAMLDGSVRVFDPKELAELLSKPLE